MHVLYILHKDGLGSPLLLRPTISPLSAGVEVRDVLWQNELLPFSTIHEYTESYPTNTLTILFDQASSEISRYWSCYFPRASQQREAGFCK